MPENLPKAVGLLGGTFDPIHYGHLRLAEEVAEACRLEEIRLIPAGIPPHRNIPGTEARHRLEMVRLAIQGNPLLVADDRETRKTGPSYTVETLTELRSEFGRDTPVFLLMGGDAFLGLASWHRWKDLFTLAHIVVAQRPGFTIDPDKTRMPPELAKEYLSRSTGHVMDLHGTPAGRVARISIPALDVSATLIRERIAAGRSIRYLLPDQVLDYIQGNRLYLKEGT